VSKTPAQDIFDGRLSLDALEILINKIRARFYNSVDLYSCVGNVWVTITSQWCHCCHFLS